MPRHGYDLIRAIREKGWGGGAGSVYPLLAALEAAGLIAGRDEGDRRIYEITDKGTNDARRARGRARAAFSKRTTRTRRPQPGDARAQLRDSAASLMQAVSQLGLFEARDRSSACASCSTRARKEIYEAASGGVRRLPWRRRERRAARSQHFRGGQADVADPPRLSRAADAQQRLAVGVADDGQHLDRALDLHAGARRDLGGLPDRLSCCSRSSSAFRAAAAC